MSFPPIDRGCDSDTSSIEIHDGIVDEWWFDNHNRHSKPPTGDVLKTEEDSKKDSSNGLFNRVLGKTEKSLAKRIAEFEENELKVFIAQKLFKVDGILCDEQTRLVLIDKMIISPSGKHFDDQQLDRKYGRELAGWLRDRLVPTVSDCSTVLYKAATQFTRLKSLDPLCNWYNPTSEASSLVTSRIIRFAEQMANRVKWSLLVEPGKFSCHLTAFIAEFNRLESLLTSHDLSPEETSQTSFNANYLTKARNKLIPCCDSTRVILKKNEDGIQERNRVIDGMYQDYERTSKNINGSTYGSCDFIHANYIRGGPLLNTFICTQAPMDNTQNDFWRMVYGEGSRLIIMLCAAVDITSLGPLTKSQPGFCPYYWPRSEGDVLRFGSIEVRNVRVDGTADPLFVVTHLEVKDTRDGGNILHVEHWHWDWQYMGDVHWPFRVLRRARLNSSPTIVQCLDGCGRSGTLVAIEAVLTQFLRGVPLEDDTVLLSAVFIRLQRRLSIASPYHYLFIYRTILHWIQPFVSSFWQRMSLGLLWDGVGFIHKYDAMIKEQTRITPAF